MIVTVYSSVAAQRRTPTSPLADAVEPLRKRISLWRAALHPMLEPIPARSMVVQYVPQPTTMDAWENCTAAAKLSPRSSARLRMLRKGKLELTTSDRIPFSVYWRDLPDVDLLFRNHVHISRFFRSLKHYFRGKEPKFGQRLFWLFRA